MLLAFGLGIISNTIGIGTAIVKIISNTIGIGVKILVLIFSELVNRSVYSSLSLVTSTHWAFNKFNQDRKCSRDIRFYHWTLVKSVETTCLMATGWTGTPGLNAPSLNCMRARRFVLVPSGQRNSCGRLSSPESARALIRSLASCRDSAVRLKKKQRKKSEISQVFSVLPHQVQFCLIRCIFISLK